MDSSSFGGGARFPFWATRGPSSIAIVEGSAKGCHERVLGDDEGRGGGGGGEEEGGGGEGMGKGGRGEEKARVFASWYLVRRPDISKVKKIQTEGGSLNPKINKSRVCGSG